MAARWEYRNTPLVDLEKVRAFTSRHTCTLPSHCLILLREPILLDRSHAVGAVELLEPRSLLTVDLDVSYLSSSSGCTAPLEGGVAAMLARDNGSTHNSS